MIALISFLLWIVFAILEGRREAYYFSMKVKAVVSTSIQSIVGNEHILFTIQRSVVLLILFLCTLSYGWICSTCTVMACIFAFPFLHDGEYYETRNLLDGIYPLKWWDQSTTSTALSDKLHLFSPVSRTILFGISVGLIIFELIKTLN